MSEKTYPGAASDGPSDSLSAARQTMSQERLRLYEFGSFRLDPVERILLHGNEIVPLTPKAFDTLHLLVRNSGHLLEKDELIQALWPETFVEEGSLSNNIFLLRKALGEDQVFIETVPRRGYRFVGAVLQLPSPRHQEKPQLELAGPTSQHRSSGHCWRVHLRAVQARVVGYKEITSKPVWMAHRNQRQSSDGNSGSVWLTLPTSFATRASICNPTLQDISSTDSQF